MQGLDSDGSYELLVNEILVRMGYATVFQGEVDQSIRYKTRMEDAEEAAEEELLGLWWMCVSRGVMIKSDLLDNRNKLQSGKLKKIQALNAEVEDANQKEQRLERELKNLQQDLKQTREKKEQALEEKNVLLQKKKNTTGKEYQED